MTPEEVLKQLEKHEASCDKRYADIQDQLKRLDTRLWGIAFLIVAAAGLEHIF
jgi:chaperonin cofactor prefoldin